MGSSVNKNELILDGVVQYELSHDASGQPIMDARWVSTRIVGSGQTGTGRAVRIADDGGVKAEKADLRYEGNWTIEYFGPDAKLAVTAFLLTLTKNDNIYHGQWSLPNGEPVLEGFGFEHAGRLLMRYGSER